jgi:SAM-dependent methyltransferase
MVGAVHERLVFGRRTRILSSQLAGMIPPGAHVLDVGCGDGTIDNLIQERRPDIRVEGIDVLIRPNTRIPVREFDGYRIPFTNTSFDLIMFVDVLHHTNDPTILLREAARVGRSVLIKDHFKNGLLANETLRFMDWVGNAHHGVSLPYNYWPKSKWMAAFRQLDWRVVDLKSHLQLYHAPFCWIFDRGLHFIVYCDRAR